MDSVRTFVTWFSSFMQTQVRAGKLKIDLVEVSIRDRCCHEKIYFSNYVFLFNFVLSFVWMQDVQVDGGNEPLSFSSNEVSVVCYLSN